MAGVPFKASVEDSHSLIYFHHGEIRITKSPCISISSPEYLPIFYCLSSRCLHPTPLPQSRAMISYIPSFQSSRHLPPLMAYSPAMLSQQIMILCVTQHASFSNLPFNMAYHCIRLFGTSFTMERTKIPCCTKDLILDKIWRFG